jgi:hypothetical protein
MNNPNFKVVFNYTKTKSPYKGKKVTRITCSILNTDGAVIVSESVTPFHRAVENRLYGRKVAFEKIIGHFNKTERTELWNIFRTENIQPEKGRVRLRNIEVLLKRFPGIQENDFNTISKTIRSLLTTVKNYDPNITKEEKAEIRKEKVPNAEPMTAQPLEVA